MPNLGIPELLIILAIVVLLFGVGKLPQLGKGLGEGIRNFKQAVKDGDKDPEKKEPPTGTAPGPLPPRRSDRRPPIGSGIADLCLQRSRGRLRPPSGSTGECRRVGHRGPNRE